MTRSYSNVSVWEGRSVLLASASISKSEVLNDRFPLKFHRRGHLIEGVILATGLKPIPKEYVHGMTVPFKLTFWDQFGKRNQRRVEAFRRSLDDAQAEIGALPEWPS